MTATRRDRRAAGASRLLGREIKERTRLSDRTFHDPHVRIPSSCLAHVFSIHMYIMYVVVLVEFLSVRGPGALAQVFVFPFRSC